MNMKQADAFAREVEAYRASVARFVNGFLETLASAMMSDTDKRAHDPDPELRSSPLLELAKTEHEHHTLVIVGDKAMVLRVRVSFGDLVAKEQLTELIAASESKPGGVPLA